ncbi:transposase [Microcoleus sp. FACHB-61]|uniref:zinc ribbon domain-containing protein n=1 Tax=Microcoleus vaginatus TaxID=119532 RepID=UPI001681CF86|nr:transposase [Microcoleus sp. FACHB-61]
MPLKNCVYVCPACGHTADRDLNGAQNIERWFEGIFIPGPRIKWQSWHNLPVKWTNILSGSLTPG